MPPCNIHVHKKLEYEPKSKSDSEPGSRTPCLSEPENESDRCYRYTSSEVLGFR